MNYLISATTYYQKVLEGSFGDLQNQLAAARYDQFVIEIVNQSYSLVSDAHPIANITNVLFRDPHKVPAGSSAIGYALQRAGVSCGSEHWTRLNPTENKISQMLMLLDDQEFSLLIPDTFYILDGNSDQISWITRKIKYPCVAKGNNATNGQNNYLVNSEAELISALEKIKTDILIQEYIPNDGDVRVLLLADQEPLVFKRGSECEYLHNTKRGSQVSEFNMSAELLAAAKSIQSRMGYKYVGIDLMQHRDDDTWYFIEANATPAIFSGGMISEKKRMLERAIEDGL